MQRQIEKRSFSYLSMPRRILSKMKSKIVKAESRDKSRNAVFHIWLCRNSPVKDKIKDRDQEQRQIGKHSFRDLAMRPSFIIFAPRRNRPAKRGIKRRAIKRRARDYTGICRRGNMEEATRAGKYGRENAGEKAREI